MADRKKLDQKIQEILDTSAEEKYIFRGEKECYEDVSSNLYRYYKKLFKEEGFVFGENTHLPILESEEATVEKARNHFRPNASNIEVLTELQHYGEKTALIDFTLNVFIALFFACNGSFGKNGRIILLKAPGIPVQKDISYLDRNDYTIIAPIGKNTRVVFQNSMFVHVAGGYLERDKYEFISIEAELKEGFLNYLRQYHNIKPETVYNDIHGFIEDQENYREAEKNFYLALKCEKDGNLHKALAYYSQSIESKPYYPEAYVNRGLVKHHLGENEEAIKDFDRSMELNPGLAEAYSNRGLCRSDLGDNEEAIEDCDRAIELKPGLSEAYHNRGVAKYRLGENEEAIKDFDRAIELNPSSAEAYSGRGLCRSDLGDNEEAIKDCDRAIELNPDFAHAYDNRGIVKCDLGKREEAIKDFDRAIELNPDLAEAYNNRGKVKSCLGKLEEALEDYKKAVGLNPNLIDAWDNLNRARSDLASGKI